MLIGAALVAGSERSTPLTNPLEAEYRTRRSRAAAASIGGGGANSLLVGATSTVGSAHAMTLVHPHDVSNLSSNRTLRSSLPQLTPPHAAQSTPTVAPAYSARDRARDRRSSTTSWRLRSGRGEEGGGETRPQRRCSRWRRPRPKQPPASVTPPPPPPTDAAAAPVPTGPAPCVQSRGATSSSNFDAWRDDPINVYSHWARPERRPDRASMVQRRLSALRVRTLQIRHGSWSYA